MFFTSMQSKFGEFKFDTQPKGKK